MKKFTCLFLLFSLSNSVAAQYVVIDSITKTPLSYVAIKFDKNDGVYSNELGKFNLDTMMGDSISLYLLGYQKKELNIKNILNDTVYLKPLIYELEEVIVSKKPKITGKIKKYKPEQHNDFIQSHWLFIGAELATLIPNTSESDYLVLKSLLIPVITRTISFDESMYGKAQNVKVLPFSSMYQIKFYENLNGKPGGQIVDEDIIVVLNEKLKIAEVNLENLRIEVPPNGLFVSVLNLGETDENGILISTSPFVIKKSESGKTAKVRKPTKPFFPVYYSEKKNNTYIRFNFDNIPSWEIFYKNGKNKNGEYHNVKFGYEVIIY